MKREKGVFRGTNEDKRRWKEIQKNAGEGCMMCITVNQELQRINKDDV